MPETEIIETKPEVVKKPVFYTVKAGDTMYSISKKHNTTVDQIKEMNQMNHTNLSIGDKLILSYE